LDFIIVFIYFILFLFLFLFCLFFFFLTKTKKGASGALGKQLVEKFLKQKCEVIGWDIRAESLKQMKTDLASSGIDGKLFND
jgi:hypothetical protein